MSEKPGVSPGLLRITVLAAVASLFLGVILLSGCEFIYLPECDTDCQAAGGADAYSKG